MFAQTAGHLFAPPVVEYSKYQAENSHRLKSLSMGKFTSQEVAALQEGKNQHAKEIYFKEWILSVILLLTAAMWRGFIKHVYVDRRYSGQENYDKPPRGKMDDKEDFYENKRIDGYQGGSRSPPNEDTYDRRYSDRSSPGGRNDDRNSRYGSDERRHPGYDQESRQYGDYRRSPTRPEVVNDWRQEDRFRNERKAEDCIVSDKDSKLEGRSPEHPKESFSPPIVRPVREILGENVIPLCVSEPPKANGGRTVGCPQTQRIASSSSLGSSVAPTVTRTRQTTATQSIVQPPTFTNDNNWASFDLPRQTNVSQAPNVNTLDAVRSQLVPASVPGQIQALPFGAGPPASAPVSNFSTLPPTDALTAAPGLKPTSSDFLLAYAGAFECISCINPQAVSKPFQDVTSAVSPQHPLQKQKQVEGMNYLRIYLLQPILQLHQDGKLSHHLAWGSLCNIILQWYCYISGKLVIKVDKPFDLGGEAPQPQTQTVRYLLLNYFVVSARLTWSHWCKGL
ncbi:putative ADP-ribosylation factor GTPase-activating protein AGD14-like isoform X3 [Hibiscus syriacus]|uniref:ADP-ribosylation factor GTPase-activating protein AGD14-like isoform X3 n=1 Tax=Hibiscus syriacus TaxID=106335 RepID=A0A6A2Y1J3_HIBSY|nr:putative ADP-ribosylation factor GTPase-activating protein AGD14-like isoform X3 [Hibiscus syriacus]